MVNAKKNLALSADFLGVNSSLIKPKIRHRSRHFELYLAARPRFLDVIPSAGFCPNGFRLPFFYYSGFRLLLSRIILRQNALNAEDDSSEDREVDNRLQIIHFADLVRMQSQLQVSPLPTNFKSDGVTSHDG